MILRRLLHASCGVLMLLAAAVILGGVRSISKVCSMLVPFMALLYVLGCIYILCMNALMAIPNLLSLIFLNGVIVHETRKYLWRDRLDREMNEF